MSYAEISIQDIKVTDIVKQFGTPLYIYNADTIIANFHGLKNSLQQKVDIFYSIKANPNISICALLAKQQAGMEVCSLIELETVIKAGCKPENIIFVGPAKKSSEIKRCLELNIYTIVCESKEEILLIAELAKSLNVAANVTLRINPNFVTKNAPLKMGGKASQFGIDLQEILHSGDLFFALPNIRIMGIHVYNGTRILEPTVVAENTQKIFSLTEFLQEKWKIKFSLVDIGGGVGIPYFSDEKKFCLQKFANLMQPTINNFRMTHPNTRIIMESGRYLVGTAGMLVSEVQYVKASHGELFLITDAGMNCHLAAVGIGTFVKRNFPILCIKQYREKSKDDDYAKYNITGPLCTPGDLVGKQVLLPKMNTGDLIAILFSGAYGPTASPILFLSHGYPAEVLINQGKPYLIRERDTTEDLLRKQHLCIN